MCLDKPDSLRFNKGLALRQFSNVGAISQSRS